MLCLRYVVSIGGAFYSFHIIPRSFFIIHVVLLIPYCLFFARSSQIAPWCTNWTIFLNVVFSQLNKEKRRWARGLLASVPAGSVDVGFYLTLGLKDGRRPVAMLTVKGSCIEKSVRSGTERIRIIFGPTTCTKNWMPSAAMRRPLNPFRLKVVALSL